MRQGSFRPLVATGGGRNGTGRHRPGAGIAAVAGGALPLAGCSGAPALDVVGSYFPAWMLCALIGIVFAVCLRQIFVILDVEGALVVPLLTHALVALAATLGAWLLWFGH